MCQRPRSVRPGATRHHRPRATLSPGETRRALTLVEMLVSMVITLVMLFAIVQIFQSLGGGMQQSRAAIEMSTQLRSAIHRLQQDLELATAPTLPWARSESGATGYFEYIEGPAYDRDPNNPESLDISDVDDILAFTIASEGEPFVATVGGTLEESYKAEVVWWVAYDDENGNNQRDETEVGMLYRRLIPLRARLNHSLGELVDRRNRFAHTGNFPHPLDRSQLVPLSGVGEGEDVALSNVINFDVRAFDPDVENRFSGDLDGDGDASNDPIEFFSPGDPEYSSATSYGPQPRGAYIDLNVSSYASVSSGRFTGLPVPANGPGGSAQWSTAATWDTWPFLYEHDGVDQDNDGTVDQATDGLDSNNSGVVDDVSERETSPPYPFPLRGIRIRVRVFEPTTDQVRQTTLVHEFMPE